MPVDKIVTDRADWERERIALLKREKAHMRESDALAAERRQLPMLKIVKPYKFSDGTGDHTLAELFQGKSQLVLYHFMYGEDWEAGCPSCSFWADNLDGIERHLAARDVRFAMVSSAPYPIIAAYKARMAWNFDWFSVDGSDFNQDMGVSFTPEELEARTQIYNFRKKGFSGPEAPGLTVFRRIGDEVYLTYATFARGLEAFNGTYQLLDLVPKGRDEGDLAFTMAWLKRRDEY